VESGVSSSAKRIHSQTMVEFFSGTGWRQIVMPASALLWRFRNAPGHALPVDLDGQV